MKKKKRRLSVKKTISSEWLFERTIAVDFDGTISQMIEFPKIGKPKPHVREALSKLRDSGFVIVIQTGRTNCYLNGDESRDVYLQKVIDWLYKHEIPWDEIDLGEVGKFPAKYIIDDRAFYYDDNWDVIVKKILKNFLPSARLANMKREERNNPFDEQHKMVLIN